MPYGYQPVGPAETATVLNQMSPTPRLRNNTVGFGGGVGVGIEEAVRRERKKLMGVIERKDREIELFKIEMGKVVEEMEELRRQGVVV
ncbi:hypothetical protein HK097_005173 [Rhizophlyctis rosea]|uniref:Uncharacterized protein n=1 Tax=Rhizophlyctis rosea TaxID=64517 RepID=A0AAD5SDM9_9FUNG|nr:hypothetical protein HK097_005173 [Rhizophlyctis rosea]